MAHAQHGNLPSRTNTIKSSEGGYVSDEDAVPDAAPSDTTGVLLERLQAWKHCCAYLEDYVKTTEKMLKEHSKDYGKVMKSISAPLREGHHFDQATGGVAGLFENMRTNTQVCIAILILHPVLSGLTVTGNSQLIYRGEQVPRWSSFACSSTSAQRNQKQA